MQLDGEIIWFAVQTKAAYRSRTHARLLTEKGLAERPLCGVAYGWGEPEPTRARCRACEDRIAGRRAVGDERGAGRRWPVRERG
jgi:hypothetical protein